MTATIERLPLRLRLRPLIAATIALAVVVGALMPVTASAQPEGGSSGAHAHRDDHPVIISEVAPGWGDRPDASYVELRNVSAAPVDLTGWNLYRCSEEGLRAKRGAPDSEFSGVVLAPGEHYLIARAGERPAGAAPDDVMSAPFGAGGYGYVLEDPEQRVADSVAVYPTTPWMVHSECDPRGSLPDIVDTVAGESYQRFGATVSDDGRFVIAPATPGSANRAGRVEPPSTSGVTIAEVAPFGPAGSGDDLIELRNDGGRAVSLAGWTLVRCTATGERWQGAPQVTFGDEHSIAPGEQLVIVGPESSIRDADAVMATSLADAAYGLQVRDANDALVDELASAHQRDSACQSGPDKLPAALDAVRGESHQLRPDGEGWVIAPRTPGAANARAEESLRAESVLDTGIVVSELATDPLDVRAITQPQNFVELSNRSTGSVDVGGWQVWACDRDGTRRPQPLASLPPGTLLEAGASLVVAAEGTATDAELRYAVPLDFLGTGVLVETAEGGIADRVGVYHVNEMDESVEPPSPCTNAVSLVTFQPDRLRGETYQRVGRSGVDLVDFVTAAASPGLAQSAMARAVGLVEPRERAAAAAARSGTAAEGLRAAPLAATVSVDDDPATPPVPSGPTVARAVAGTTGPEPAVDWPLAAERAVDADDAGTLETLASGYDHPALRLELAAPVDGTLTWTGSVSPRHRVVLSAWDAGAAQWSIVGEAVADVRGAATVTGETAATEALLVQVLPAPRAAADLEPDAAFEQPQNVDASIVHLTDTQYLSEGYPEEYERMTRWVVELAQRQDLAAVVHTGDLVQSWVDPDQSDARARIEFARASAAQSVLEEAGLVTTVLPGNHDTKRGIDAGLYNEYFGPERYADAPGFVAPIAPDDATSSYTIVQAGPAPVLVLSIGYGYGERELAWAERIVRQHSDHNVVIATHEHLTPLTRWDPARRATDNRWLSRADELWERVVAPNRNVVAVLAGHYHGLGAIVTPDAGGIEGHDVVELLADYQEFRTDTGERATGFLRMLQWDLAAGQLLVDTYSPRLDSTISAAYDYPQFVLESGVESRPANGRPWNIVALGAEGRYGVADDEFAVPVTLQYAKMLRMTGLALAATGAEPLESQSRGPQFGVPRV